MRLFRMPGSATGSPGNGQSYLNGKTKAVSSVHHEKTIPFLLIACAAAVLAGLAAAQVHISQGERESAERKLAEANEAKRPARYPAELVAIAEEVVISYRAANGDREVRFADPGWLTRFSSVVGAGSFKPTPHGLWASSPRIRFYQHKKGTLDLMIPGKFLRAYSEAESGDFIVGTEITQAILLLVQEKAPNPEG